MFEKASRSKLRYCDIGHALSDCEPTIPLKVFRPHGVSELVMLSGTLALGEGIPKFEGEKDARIGLAHVPWQSTILQNDGWRKFRNQRIEYPGGNSLK